MSCPTLAHPAAPPAEHARGCPAQPVLISGQKYLSGKGAYNDTESLEMNDLPLVGATVKSRSVVRCEVKQAIARVWLLLAKGLKFLPMLVISRCRSLEGLGALQLCSARRPPSLTCCRVKRQSRCSRVRAQPPDAPQQGVPSSAAAPVTDQAVPEGHQGLHNFLYASGEQEHASSQRYDFRQVGAVLAQHSSN